ncbi:hypothetical protein Bca101_016716 [Brassica carinata]
MEESFSEEELLCDIWPEDYLRFRKRQSRKPRGEDTISKLPDSLISQILSHLPTTKEAVRTSVLSKRWKSLYLLIPALTLNANEFPNHNAFVSFIDRFLDFSREQNSILHKLKLSVQKKVNDPPCATRWIDSVSSSKLNHLDIECLVNRKFLEMIPQSLCVCDTLVSLRLHRVSLGEFECVSLPCLKKMVLEHNVYANDASLESFISSCSVLEDLSIVRMAPDNIKFLRVCSKTLASLHVDYIFGEDDDYDDEGFERDGSGVFIDAPRLTFLKFEEDLSDSKIITNSGSLAKVNLVFLFSENDTAVVIDLPKRDMIRNFFTSISGVTDMKLSAYIVEFLHYNSEFDPLDFYHPDDEAAEIKSSSIPRCLQSSLEHVEIKRFNAEPARMKVARFLDFSKEENSILHKLKLTLRKNVNDPPCVTRWIDSVASSKLNHLDVECVVNRKFLEVIPQSLYVCDTLAYLRLHRVSLGEFESVSLPCLKKMVLEHNVYANDASLELFISSCSVLEDLSIVRMAPDMIKVLRVCSKTLTSLHIDYFFGEDDDFDDEGFERDGSGVFIDAPRLEFLKFEDDLSDCKIITNSGSLAKVDIVFVFSENDTADLIDLPKRDMVRNFFTSISGVTDMKLSSHIVEQFLHFNNQFDPLVLPKFCNLSRLKLKIFKSCLKMLPTLLERCPNLKTLILDFNTSDEKAARIRASPVPRCLLSSLEHVEIKCFNGGPARMAVARYFVKNSLVLKKLVMDVRCSTAEKGFYFTEEGVYMLRDLLALPRPSSTCQILLK